MKIAVGKVILNVFDTRGTMDASPEAHEKATIEIVGNILDAEKGVIIICIKMYERIDESTLATLAMLHQKYEFQDLETYCLMKHCQCCQSRLIDSLVHLDANDYNTLFCIKNITNYFNGSLLMCFWTRVHCSTCVKDI